jgi:hypothetical protein
MVRSHGDVLVRALIMGAAALASLVASGRAQDLHAPKAVAYCPDLKRVITLVLTKEKFSTIAGAMRAGNFFDTTLPLTGWRECSLYGSRTYTCDSPSFASLEEAAKIQAAIVDEIKTCLGEGWTEDDDRSSPTYAVVRSSRVPVSMTIATNADGPEGYVVRLTLFLRTGG